MVTMTVPVFGCRDGGNLRGGGVHSVTVGYALALSLGRFRGVDAAYPGPYFRIHDPVGATR